MNEHEKINYVEFPSKNLQATKDFFSQVFGWSFEDVGPEYSAFSNQGIDGGFFKSELSSSTKNGAALIVFYSQQLEATQTKIEEISERKSRHFIGTRFFSSLNQLRTA